MAMNTAEEMETLAEVTDFFADADRTREELLAQPETECTCGCVCNCGNCECPDGSNYINQNPNSGSILSGNQGTTAYNNKHVNCLCGCVCDCGNCACPEGSNFINQNPNLGNLKTATRNPALEAAIA